MIFLDTGYFRGLMNVKDNHHEDALKIKDYLNEINENTVINTTVLVEILNRSVGSPINVKSVYDILHKENKVIQLTDNDYQKSLDINKWYGNSINYSDCTILKTMMDMGINRIVYLTAVLKILKDIKLFQACDVSIMKFTYEIKNLKLKKMVEKKAKEMHMSIDELIWGYINRGLMADNLNEDVFEEVHSQKFLMEVNDALGVD